MAEFKIDPNKDADTEDLRYDVVDINGISLGNPKDKMGVAKKVYNPNTDSYTFFVKTSTVGRDKGRLFNPSGMFTVALDSRNLETGKMHYEYKKVSEKCFARYTEFVKNKGTLSLKHAQREADY